MNNKKSKEIKYYSDDVKIFIINWFGKNKERFEIFLNMLIVQEKYLNL